MARCVRRGSVIQPIRTRIMKTKPLNTDKLFYPIAALSRNGSQTLVCVHRLVAEAFIPNPENKPQVNHKDGHKSNNYISNLEWATPKEDSAHAVRIGLIKTGQDHHLAKISNSVVRDIIKEYALGKISQDALAKKHGVSQSLISAIVLKQKRKNG